MRTYGIVEVAVTPDFHKGSGVPIGTVLLSEGFVLPQAIGKDVNCGMRLHTTSLTEGQVRARFGPFTAHLRHVFFEGGRQIPMVRRQREALLRNGLPGLWEERDSARGQGLWALYDAREEERNLERTLFRGCVPCERIPFLEDYLGKDQPTYDDQIGSIGGGNHFVEVQVVERIHDGATAHAWGLKGGQVVVMIHSGCVKLGYPTGVRSADMAREIYPGALCHPDNGIFPLPDAEPYRRQWDTFWNAYGNAANFAFGNRLFLALMIRRVLLDKVGDTDFPLVYDAGHNIVTREGRKGTVQYLHRKGATPARGYDALRDTPFACFGEPVLIPGSMGASSFLMAGLGCEASLCSASHGAGRSLSRGQAMKATGAQLQEFLSRFHIVTPLDPNRPDIRRRSELIRKWEDDLKQEAPWAYKDIAPVIDTQTEAGMVRKVAELRPILTVKG